MVTQGPHGCFLLRRTTLTHLILLASDSESCSFGGKGAAGMNPLNPDRMTPTERLAEVTAVAGARADPAPRPAVKSSI